MRKEQILDFLAEMKKEWGEIGVDKIGLFGSYAKENADPFSDIDIAIKLNESYLDEHDVWAYFDLLENIRETLQKRFSRKVDIFDLNSNNTPIKESILKDLIYA